METVSPMSAEAPRYFAYVCSAPADDKWARWLRGRLRAYRLPPRTRRNHRELPARGRPPAPGRSGGFSPEDVRSSRFFIMICSRAACEQSGTMEEELRCFLDGGGDASAVIPFIVDDSKTPELDCFPPALRELCRARALLGANIYDSGRRSAFLKVLAYMHGLKLEEIEGDDDRRRRRRRASLAAAAVLCLLALWRGWDYFGMKTAYYLDYTERYGVPVGIGPLSLAEADTVYRRYAISSSRGRVRELRYEDSAGELAGYGQLFYYEYQFQQPGCEALYAAEAKDRPVLARYSYGDGGALLRTEYYNVDGQKVAQADYLNANTADVTQNMENTLFPSGKITRLLLDYDAGGFVSRLRYVGDRNTNQALTDSGGAAGLRFERDEQGRVVRAYNLVRSGTGSALTESAYSDGADSRGVLAEERIYSETGELAELRRLGADGVPAAGEDGCALLTFSYDARHNLTGIRFAGADGSPVLPGGCAGCALAYDAEGRPARVTYLDAEGRPALSGYGAAGYNMSAGTEAVSEDGAEKQILRFDFSFFGTDGEPLPTADGYAAAHLVITTDPGAARRERVTFYTGLGGEPVLCADGYARQSLELENGRLVRESYYGLDGSPVISGAGYASAEIQYDRWGNQTRLDYYDPEGRPCAGRDGYATMLTRYGADGTIQSQEYYGPDGSPALHADGGYARIEFEHDAGGYQTGSRVYGPDGLPVRSYTGVHSTRMLRDESGALIETLYCDDLGNQLTGVCPVFFPAGERGTKKTLHDDGVLVRFGSWRLSSADAEEYRRFSDVFAATQETEIEYLLFNAAAGRWELYRSPFVTGKMGLVLGGYYLAEAERQELLDALAGEPALRPLLPQSTGGDSE